MRTIERIWPGLLAATLATTIWTAAAPAAELATTTAARPATTAVATSSKSVPAQLAPIRLEPTPIRLASRLEPARECSVSPYCRGHFLLILGVAY